MSFLKIYSNFIHLLRTANSYNECKTILRDNIFSTIHTYQEANDIQNIENTPELDKIIAEISI